MVLHLGGEVIIPMKDVIAIFDLETSKDSKINNEFLEIVKDEGFIRVLSEDAPKTFVLTEFDNKITIYLSPISSSTLLKRTGFIQNISFSKKQLEQGGYDGE
ncbi:MAG TPA: DUF370 domain-containing protein [Clostridia bacterium]|nr:DUF370 domain-containing protein [Clostridia bacterium]